MRVSEKKSAAVNWLRFVDDLVHCYEKPFSDGCGVEAGWWACEYERTGAMVWMPQCLVQCSSEFILRLKRTMNASVTGDLQGARERKARIK
jgi:hypothetical protein